MREAAKIPFWKHDSRAQQKKADVAAQKLFPPYTEAGLSPIPIYQRSGLVPSASETSGTGKQALLSSRAVSTRLMIALSLLCTVMADAVPTSAARNAKPKKVNRSTSLSSYLPVGTEGAPLPPMIQRNLGSDDYFTSASAHTITTSASGARSVYAADMNGDGHMDALSASEGDGTIAWYENNGAQVFTPHTITASAVGAFSVYAVDMNGDGFMDVLSASGVDNKIAWYKNVQPVCFAGFSPVVGGTCAACSTATYKVARGNSMQQLRKQHYWLRRSIRWCLRQRIWRG